MPSFHESAESKFVWKIENFSCLKGERFFNKIPTVSGNIAISQENSYIIARLIDSNNCYTGCFFSFSILDSDGAPLICKERKIVSNKTSEEDIKFPNETQFFPNNILRLEFHLWRRVNYIAQPMSLFACTRLQPIAKMVKKAFSCVISDLLNEPVTNFSQNISNGLNLGIRFTLPYSGQASVQLTTELFGFNTEILVFLIDNTGKSRKFGNHVTKFESSKRACQFDIDLSRNMLLCHASKFLVSGTLTLQFTCTFTGQFYYDSIVEENEIFNSHTVPNSSTATVSEADTHSNETDKGIDEPEVSHTNGPDTISQAFQKMLREGYFSDFTLKVGDRTFPVHKNILGMRSKVFRAMFESEMKEVQDNRMDIKDIGGDTLQKMLQFVYSDRIDKDMDSTEASSLYAAADFYALENLKQSCSTILKDGLSTPNALGVLALADLHQDHQLKSAALDFISLYDQDIVDTEAWIKFEEENAKLAMETLRKLYARKMRG